MKIRIRKDITEEVTLSDEQITQITRSKLWQLVHPGEFLRKDKDRWIIKRDDPAWRHGSISEVFVREATELDRAVFKVLERL